MVMSGELRSTDITVNLEGLWLVQALLGITQLAPELMGRPFGHPENTAWLTEHRGLAVLVEQGICATAGAVVRADIVERMAVLAAPDVELVMHGQRRAAGCHDRRCFSRTLPTWLGNTRRSTANRVGAPWSRWASAVRTGNHITIDDCAAVDYPRLERVDR